MTLSKREKRLAIAVGALGAPLALWLLFTLFSGDLGTLSSQVAVQKDKLEKLQDQVVRAKKAQDCMARWNRQALPSDVARAGSLYQNWLLEIAGKAGFRQKKVEPGEAHNRGDVYQLLPFTVHGQATLDELVGFLFEFYSAGYLHQIRRLVVRPVEKSKDLDVLITIEALSLPEADRKDQLSKEAGKRLALGSLEEYRKAIGGRNILAPYSPPMVAKASGTMSEPKSEPFDPSKYAYVTGIVQVNGEPQVWVKARTTDEKYQLHQGDGLQIGPFHATIARINPRDVEIEVQGQRHTIPLGGNVRGSEGEAKKPAEASEPKTPGVEPKADAEKRRPEGGEERRDRSRRRRDFGGPGPSSNGPMPTNGGPGPGFGGPGSEARSPGPEGGGPRPEGKSRKGPSKGE